MAYGQQGGRRKKRPYDWMIRDWTIQGQADAGVATSGVMAGLEEDRADAERAADVAMADRNYALTEQNMQNQADAAQTAQGMSTLTLGGNLGSKYGGWGDGASGGSSWGDWAGSAAGGAGLGYGLANIFGDKSKKNQMWGAGLGALAGGLGSYFNWF